MAWQAGGSSRFPKGGEKKKDRGKGVACEGKRKKEAELKAVCVGWGEEGATPWGRPSNTAPSLKVRRTLHPHPTPTRSV
eukprot:scaffold27035_cov90-Isochrysis_galbana.AAC.1